MTRVAFSRRLTRSGAAWTGVAVAAVVGSGVWSVLQGEDLLVVSAGTVGFLGFFAVWALRSRQWLELGGEEPVLVQRRLLHTRRVGLRTARSVGLRTNGGGSLQLLAVPPYRGRPGTVATRSTGPSAFAPVLLLTGYTEQAQPVPVHDALVAALEDSRAPGAQEAAEQLRRQAEHLRAGGSPRSSPLAGLVVDVLPGGGGGLGR